MTIHKAARKEHMLEMREEGRSYREIGAELGIHWTRVWQIVKHARTEKQQPTCRDK